MVGRKQLSLIALISFIGVSIVATIACILLMPLLVPKYCDDVDPSRSESFLELSSASGATLRIDLNTKQTSKRVAKYYHCDRDDQYLRQTADSSIGCKTYEWRVPQFVKSISDCVHTSGQFWFGGSTMWEQRWPINGLLHDEAAYIPGDNYAREFGGVMERFWISSGGFALYVEPDVPLLVEYRQDKLCMTGSIQDGLPYNLAARSDASPLLAYTVCSGPSIRDLYLGLKLWQFPTETPARDLFRRPIWSTWAYLKQNITSESVLEFARNISNNDLSCSQVEVDDKWSTNYGDHVFDLTRFPQPQQLVKDIRQLGYNATIWMHPFVNNDTAAFGRAVASMAAGGSYLLARSDNSSRPAFTSWWRGDVSTIIDVTHPDSQGAKELSDRLQGLVDLGFDSFKFDGGETNWIPANATLAAAKVNPGWYTFHWSEFANRSDTRLRRQETRVGFRAQHLPFLVRTMDKDSHWGLDNGLKAIVTSALTHCLIGYNYYLPDMVGGNAYCNGTGLEGFCYPERELYIRWLQVSVFMPSIQFSMPPWIFSDDAVPITRRMLAVREEARFQENMDKALRDSMRDGVPIVRPIWWVENSKFEIDDQFLLGDRILVAPVLNSDQVTRKVYFPNGRWRPWFAADESSDIVGPETNDAYPVPLTEVAAFYLID